MSDGTKVPSSNAELSALRDASGRGSRPSMAYCADRVVYGAAVKSGGGSGSPYQPLASVRSTKWVLITTFWT